MKSYFLTLGIASLLTLSSCAHQETPAGAASDKKACAEKECKGNCKHDDKAKCGGKCGHCEGKKDHDCKDKDGCDMKD